MPALPVVGPEYVLGSAGHQYAVVGVQVTGGNAAGPAQVDQREPVVVETEKAAVAGDIERLVKPGEIPEVLLGQR